MVVALLAQGCGGDATDPEPEPEPEPPLACEPGTQMVGESCIAAGIPEGFCGEGFAWDPSGTCAPILPAAPCPAGQMAIVGEAECRPVAPCSSGTWGDIAIEATTQHVDGSAPAGGDGSAAAPWTTIQQAVNASAPGGQVAVAAGTYVESVDVLKPVRIEGVCPDLVVIEGPAGAQRTVLVGAQADGAVLRRLTVTGGGLGVWNIGAADVLLDRLHIHDTGAWAIEASDLEGAGSMRIVDSLLENLPGHGMLVAGVSLQVERSVVRGVTPSLQVATSSAVQLTSSGVTGAPVAASITTSVIEANTGVGVFVQGGAVTIEATALRDHQVSSNGTGGGVVGLFDEAFLVPTEVDVTGSTVERATKVGLGVAGAVMSVTHTAVRGTAMSASGTEGFGLSVQGWAGAGLGGQVTAVQSSFEDNHVSGVLVSGGDAVVEGIRVVGTQPASTLAHGRGMTVQESIVSGLPSKAEVRYSQLVDNLEAGMAVTSAEAIVDRTLVASTHAINGRLGDGIAVVVRTQAPASLQLGNSSIEDNARAGLSLFGAAASVENTSFSCNTFHFNGENRDEVTFDFVNLGGNECGCMGELVECQLLSSGLEPPDPI
jgi:hypothetical protein